MENCKSEPAIADPSEYGCTFVIDRLKLGEPAHASDSESELLLAQRRKGHISNKKIEITVLKDNVTYYITLKSYRTRKI